MTLAANRFSATLSPVKGESVNYPPCSFKEIIQVSVVREKRPIGYSSSPEGASKYSASTS